MPKATARDEGDIVYASVRTDDDQWGIDLSLDKDGRITIELKKPDGTLSMIYDGSIEELAQCDSLVQAYARSKLAREQREAEAAA